MYTLPRTHTFIKEMWAVQHVQLQTEAEHLYVTINTSKHSTEQGGTKPHQLKSSKKKKTVVIQSHAFPSLLFYKKDRTHTHTHPHTNKHTLPQPQKLFIQELDWLVFHTWYLMLCGAKACKLDMNAIRSLLIGSILQLQIWTLTPILPLFPTDVK